MSTATRVDPIAAQVLRTHLEAIAEEGFRTIERTAISPVVTESLDAGCTITDAAGGLVAGGGRIPVHYGAATQAVRSILALHADTLAPGDVFFGNDPHSGIAVHPQDVVVAQPIFVGSELAAWAVNTAHLSDMGGMSFGSWAPLATECYQEALRMPPVRLFSRGKEQVDIWSILRTNVRLPLLDEMDLRGLVAGCHVAQQRLVELIQDKGGLAWFAGEVRAMQELTQQELRRRITGIADGTYRSASWVEWETVAGEVELYWMPCTLTVDGDRLVFDYEGVPPQCPHYINSKPWIVQGRLVPDVWNYLGQDLPLNQGVLDVVEVRCPKKSLLDCEPPAPIGAAHQDAANLGAIMGMFCLVHALAASESPETKKFLTGQSAITATATQVWRAVRGDGDVDAVLMLDGVAVGTHAASVRDGNDMSPFLVARSGGLELAEVEVLERWYPILIREKRVRPGPFGAGRTRAGAGCQMAFQPHHIADLQGVMYAKRAHLPFLGLAGGMPGATTHLAIHHADGRQTVIPPKGEGVRLAAGEVFEFRCASGGGYGDPLDRDPAAVAKDVALGRLTAEEARDIYGVIVESSGAADGVATAVHRSTLLQDRLARADAAVRPLPESVTVDLDADSSMLPLYPGVGQRGRLAVALDSGAPLAIAPDHWTDGCPVLTQRLASGVGPDLIVESYLDPRTGRSLAVDARLDGNPRSVTSLPRRWVEAASAERPRAASH